MKSTVRCSKWRLAIPRKLRGVLLVRGNQVVSADRLLNDVWGNEQPRAGVRTLR